MQKKTILLLFLSFVLVLSNAQNQALNNFVNLPNLKRANISVVMKETTSGKIIMQHRADKLTIPASTMKLVTTATALETLGANFRFRTRLQYDGIIQGDTLIGNLYIIGGGDPTLGSRFLGDSTFLAGWTAAVQKLGIRTITGAVVGDASLFGLEGISPKWLWEDMGNHYGAGAYGISIFDNSYRLILRSGAVGTTPEVVRTSPEIPGLNFINHLKVTTITYDSAYIYGAPFANERYLYGAIPANKSNFVIRGDIPNPALLAAQLFEKELKNNGIIIHQTATTDLPTDKTRTTFFSQQSPPLSEIITTINRRSNNHYAEHLFRYLSLQKTQPATASGAISVINNFWRAKGLNTSALKMYDGSGLSPVNGVSANFLVDLLLYEKNKSPNSNVFLASLPVAGKSGTIQSVLKNTALQGRVQAKSGSLSGVRCYAGYLEWGGKNYAFAVLVNNFSGSYTKVISQIEQLLLSMTK